MRKFILSKVEGAKILKLAIFIAAVLGFGVFWSGGEVQAETYYVCNSSTTCNNGSSGWSTGSDNNTTIQAQSKNTPYLTIQKAYNVMKENDIAVVGNGTYVDNNADGYVLYGRYRGGKDGAPMTFRAENKWGALISGGNAGDIANYSIGDNCIQLDELTSTYIIIDGFEIAYCKGYAVILNYQTSPTNYPSHITLKNLNVHHTKHSGISGGGDYITIDGNVIHDISFYDNPVGSASGLYYGGSHLKITNNVIYNVYDYGYGMQISHNISGWSRADVVIANNTFGIAGEHQINGILLNNANTDVAVDNNIFYGLNPGIAAIRCSMAVFSNVSSNNNLIVTGKSLLDTTCNGKGITEAGSITADGNTFFTNAESNNYTLTPTSPAINHGLATNAPNHDILGVSRPQLQGGAYDIGAYEYISGSTIYYASPNGTGNGLSESSPFKIADFWAVAKPGNTLYLLDGIYRGDNSMISPPYNYNNTSKTCISYGGGEENNTITVKALHDGEVTIDGQGYRKPVYLLCQKYLVIEGVNANNSSGSVFTITDSNNNIIRRSIGWDAYDGNQSIFGISASENNLLEDVAGFGIARKTFSSSQSGNHTTIRRAWGSWDGSHEVGPKMTYTMAYNNYDMTCENCIGTWTGHQMKESYALKHENNGCYTLWNASQCASSGGVLQYSSEYGKDCCMFTNYGINQPYAVIGIDGFNTEYGFSNVANSRVLGSIAYVKSGTNYHVPIGQAYLVTKMNSFEYKDNVAYIEPGSSRKTFLLSTLQGGGGTNLFASNLTGVGGSGSQIHSDWQKSNIQEGPDIASVKNIFTSPDGARLCKRYKDRVLTNEPLWPWPMNQRIIDATTLAGREVVDFTATIEELFGTIPDECKEGGFVSADVNSDGNVNIKDIQICVKGIIDQNSIPSGQLQKCQAVALPDTVVNIKDIQAIIQKIVNLE